MSNVSELFLYKALFYNLKRRSRAFISIGYCRSCRCFPKTDLSSDDRFHFRFNFEEKCVSSAFARRDNKKQTIQINCNRVLTLFCSDQQKLDNSKHRRHSESIWGNLIKANIFLFCAFGREEIGLRINLGENQLPGGVRQAGNECLWRTIFS